MDYSNPFRPFADVGEDDPREPGSDDWTPILPVPPDAPELDIERSARADFVVSKRWDYQSAENRLLMVVARFDVKSRSESRGKEIRPFTFGHGRDGVRQWKCKAISSDRPLYRLDDLARRTAAPVLIVEGEKAVDAAQRRFSDYVVMTSSGGAMAAGKSDWSPLKARRVTIWRDCDPAGLAYQDDVIRLLHEVGAASVAAVLVPTDWPDGWDLADLPPDGIGDASLRAMLDEASSRQAEAGTWTNPDMALLGTGRRQAPVFPSELLGEFWSGWAERRAAAASAPVDYVAVALLACVGAALANVRWPLAGAGWSEPPVLWCGLVGSPSSGKSPAIDAAFMLLRDAEEAMAAGYDDIRRDHETRLQVAKATREAWEANVKDAVKDGKTPPSMPANAEIEEMPPRPRISMADATIEAKAKLASALPRGLLLARDELSGWLGSFDKYGGGGADRAFALEMYGGRAYVVDRVKNPVPIRIAHLSIGVLGGVQPDKLGMALEGPDDGLSARLLWTWPDALPGFVLARAIDAETRASHAFLRLTELEMATSPAGTPEPVIVPLARDAEDHLERFGQEVAHQSHEACGLLAGALGKARGHALRLALIIEHLWWCLNSGMMPPAAVSARAMLAAIGLVDGYFLPMAERVLGDAAVPAADRAAMVVARHLRGQKISTFNARLVRREIGGIVREASAMKAACTLLVEAGLIRQRSSRSGDIGGRPAGDYEVNPEVVRARP